MINHKEQKREAVKVLFTMAKLLENSNKKEKNAKDRNNQREELLNWGHYDSGKGPNTKIAISGGAVADWMLGRPANDVDIFTSYSVEDVDTALASLLKEKAKVLGNEEKSKGYKDTTIDRVYEFYNNGTKYNVIVCRNIFSNISAFPMTISRGYLLINTSTSQLSHGPNGFRELLENKVNLITDTHCLPHDEYFQKKRKNYPDFNFCFDDKQLPALITKPVKKSGELPYASMNLNLIYWQELATMNGYRRQQQMNMINAFKQKGVLGGRNSLTGVGRWHVRLQQDPQARGPSDEDVTREWMEERRREAVRQMQQLQNQQLQNLLRAEIGEELGNQPRTVTTNITASTDEWEPIQDSAGVIWRTTIT